MLGYVRLYSPRAKEKIRSILDRNLDKYSVAQFTDNILTCIDELIKNALKANYKYVLVREKILRILEESNDTKKFEDIVKNRDIYSEFTEKHIDLPEISKVVRVALTQEAKVIKYKMKTVKENRKYSAEEKEEIHGFKELLSIHKKQRECGARVELRINEYWNALNVEIMNNAPILNRDLTRIHDNRHEFKDYADRGEETMFFINNLDDADGGAGLGYATIDSCLREMQLDPFQAINIISVSNTTVLMYFKLNALNNIKDKNT